MMIVPDLLVKAGAVAAVSTRRGGVSVPSFGMNLSYKVGDEAAAVQQNRQLFFGALGIRLEELAIPAQVHGEIIRRAGVPGAYAECDGLITDVPRLFLCITVADCVPVLVYEPARKVVGAFHAGWRGTAARIAAAGVEKMASEFGADPGLMTAFVGPSAGVCCYEVGEEVAGRLDARFLKREGGRYHADLKRANATQLEEAGILPENIEIHPGCTIMEQNLFHSYRRDGVRSGRMMAVLGMSR